MKKILCFILMTALVITSTVNTYALRYHLTIMEGDKALVNSVRFAYDGKVHKPSVKIVNENGIPQIPSQYAIKYQNEKSILPGKYKINVYWVYDGEIIEKADSIVYEILKAPKTKKKAKKEIRRFIKKTVSDAKKKKINKVLNNSLSDGMSYMNSIDKKLIKRANKKCLKMKINKIKVSNDKLKATVKIRVKRLDYGKAIRKVGTLCYKNAIKDGYFDDPTIMSNYKYNKNMKKAAKKYPPRIKKKTIKVYMVKTFKKGWIVSSSKEDGSKIKKSEELFSESLCAGL